MTYSTEATKAKGYAAYFNTNALQRRSRSHPPTPCFSSAKEVYDWEAGWYAAKRAEATNAHG